MIQANADLATLMTIFFVVTFLFISAIAVALRADIIDEIKKGRDK